jgi:hypothetical protein
LLSLFNSYFYEPRTAGIDAFAQINWNDHVNYCNPPFAVMGRFVNFMIYYYPTAKYIIVTPWWTGQAWFPQLFDFVDQVYILPHDPCLFVRILP